MRVSIFFLLGAAATFTSASLAEDANKHPLAKSCLQKIQDETCPVAYSFRHGMHMCHTRDDIDHNNMRDMAGCVMQYRGCDFVTGPGAVCCYAVSQLSPFTHSDVFAQLCEMCAHVKTKMTNKKVWLASKLGRGHGKHMHKGETEEEGELSLTLDGSGVKCETGHHGCGHVGDACLTGDGRTRGVCVDGGLTKGGQRVCTCDEVVSFELTE